jgi:hypothetical protein
MDIYLYKYNIYIYTNIYIFNKVHIFHSLLDSANIQSQLNDCGDSKYVILKSQNLEIPVSKLPEIRRLKILEILHKSQNVLRRFRRVYVCTVYVELYV